MSRAREVEVYSAIIKLDSSAPYFVQSRTLARLRLRPTSHAAPHKLDTFSPSAPTQAELARIRLRPTSNVAAHTKLDTFAPTSPTQSSLARLRLRPTRRVSVGVIGRLSRRSEAEPGRAFARVPSARKPRGAKLSCKQARLSSGFLNTIRLYNTHSQCFERYE